MNIIRNDKLIKRNGRIAQFAMFAGLLTLGGGMYVSFAYPERVSISMVALLLGFILSQVGIFYMNRWGRKPRPDELIDNALKGLDKKNSLYHYSSPVSHLLVGPAGVWVLLPYHQRGNITYRGGRWRQSGGGLMLGYLKIFGQEGLGRPDLEVRSETQAMETFLKKHLPEEEIPNVQTALVFYDPRTEINIPDDETPPAETVLMKDLKDTLRKGGKGHGLTMEKVKLIQDAIEPG